MALSFNVTDARRLAPALDPEYDEWKAQIKTHKADMRKLKKLPDSGDAILEVGRKIGELEAMCQGAEDFAGRALEAALEVIEAKANFTVVGQIKTKDGSGDKLALGWYATEKQAIDDALKLTYSNQTHEEALAWVLPLHHGSPANWYAGRKGDRNALEAAEASYRERELGRRVQWFEEHPGEPPPEDWGLHVPFHSETTDCPMCNGTGRIPN